MVQIIDSTEQIDAFLPVLVDLGVSGLVTREPVATVELGPKGAAS